MHTQTGVDKIIIENGRAVGVETNRGVIRAGKIVQAVAGASSEVARMAGFLLPIALPSAGLRVPAGQADPRPDHRVGFTARLHFAVGARRDGDGRGDRSYGLYSSRSTLDFKESMMAHMLELFPFMGELKVLRQWAGMADMTPDFRP